MTKRVEIYKDEYSGRFKIDWSPECSVLDRRAIGHDTLKAARSAADEQAYYWGLDVQTVYVGAR